MTIFSSAFLQITNVLLGNMFKCIVRAIFREILKALLLNVALAKIY